MKVLLVLAILLALLLPAGASHRYDDSCTPTTSRPEIDTGSTPAGQLYVDNDFHPDMWSIWVYEESNGINGLQRKDEMKDDTCGMIPGDTIIF